VLFVIKLMPFVFKPTKNKIPMPEHQDFLGL